MISHLMRNWTLDDLTKLLGAIAIGGYVLGYLVLSYHLSVYGFNPVSPFRSRVLETGICALIFFAMPYLIGTAVGSLSSRGTSAAFIFVLRMLCLPILCSIPAAFPGFIVDLPRTLLLTLPSGSGWIGITKLLLIPAGFGVLYLLQRAVKWIWHHYHDRKFLSILVLLPISGISVFFAYTSASVRTYIWLLFGSTFFLVMIGDGAEQSEQKWIDSEVKNIKRIGTKIDELLGELGGVELIPPHNPILELETIKQQNAAILASVDSHT